MIRSFRSKALRVFWERNDSSKLPVKNTDKVATRLAAIDAAVRADELNIPGFRFHGLQGKPKRHAIDATGNYRITFGWDGDDAIDVDLEDYH